MMNDKELNEQILRKLNKMADEKEQELLQWAKMHPKEDAVLKRMRESGGRKLKKELVHRRSM